MSLVEGAPRRGLSLQPELARPADGYLLPAPEGAWWRAVFRSEVALAWLGHANVQVMVRIHLPMVGSDYSSEDVPSLQDCSDLSPSWARLFVYAGEVGPFTGEIAVSGLDAVDVASIQRRVGVGGGG